jgi:hypothetical protein
MAKQKINEQKRTMQKPEDELIFWEGHLRKIESIYADDPSEPNAVWKNNVAMRVSQLRQQITEPEQKSTKPKF